MDVLCQQCDEEPSTVWCKDCQACLCATCTEHLHPPHFPEMGSHTRIPVFGRPHFDKCKEHEDRVLEMFCTECRTLVCTACRDWGGHVSHDIVDLEDGGTFARTLLQSKCERSEKHAEHIRQEHAAIDGEMAAADGSLAGAEAVVRGHFAELRALLANREAELLAGARGMHAKVRRRLEAQRDEASAIAAECDAAAAASRKKLLTDDFTLMGLVAGLERRLNGAIQRERTLTDAVDTQVPCAFRSDIVSVLQSHGIVGEVTRAVGGPALEGPARGLLWDSSKVSKELELSADARAVRFAAPSGSHATAVSTTGFRHGRHVWRTEVCGLTGDCWVSLGVVTAASINQDNAGYLQDAAIFRCKERPDAKTRKAARRRWAVSKNNEGGKGFVQPGKNFDINSMTVVTLILDLPQPRFTEAFTGLEGLETEGEAEGKEGEDGGGGGGGAGAESKEAGESGAGAAALPRQPQARDQTSFLEYYKGDTCCKRIALKRAPDAKALYPFATLYGTGSQVTFLDS